MKETIKQNKGPISLIAGGLATIGGTATDIIELEMLASSFPEHHDLILLIGGAMMTIGGFAMKFFSKKKESN